MSELQILRKLSENSDGSRGDANEQASFSSDDDDGSFVEVEMELEEEQVCPFVVGPSCVGRWELNQLILFRGRKRSSTCFCTRKFYLILHGEVLHCHDGFFFLLQVEEPVDAEELRQQKMQISSVIHKDALHSLTAEVSILF